MKKIGIAVVMVLFLSGAASASLVIFEVKAGFFYPSGPELKADYGSMFMGGAEVTLGILPRLKLWAGAGYQTKKGDVPASLDTRLTLTPVGGGIKYFLSAGKIRFYGGAGVNYLQYKATSPGGDVSASGVGYVLKLGAIFNMKGPFVVDLFFENHYGSVKPGGTKVSVGGITAGVGIGFESLI